MFEEYLPRIMQCRLDDLVLETPVQEMPALSERLGVNITVKREDLQPVFSFKIRGAYAKLKTLTEPQRQRGIICASAGNHAQGVAMAASHLGIDAMVVMPAITPEIKVDAVEKLGAQVVIYGDDFDTACEKALELAGENGRIFIHPYDDPDVITGQATVALELFRQIHVPIDYLFVCVGGGGLAAGMALVSKYLHPGIKLIGVEAEESASMKAAFEAGGPVNLDRVGHFAEGVAVKRCGDLTYQICSQLLDEIITVDNDEICAAVQDVFEDTRAIAEPAGVLAIAGLKRFFLARPGCEGNAAAVLSGANVNFARLRHIAERAAVGEEQEALLGVTIPERPGSFLDFCETIGPRGITEFNYRFSDSPEAHIFVGIALRNGVPEKREIISDLRKRGFPVTDLSNNDMARLHIRHMVGGRAQVDHEQILRFHFPERTGALLQFLRGMKSDWNISLFHYRNYGSEYGRVLMGIQVPDEDADRFTAFLQETGYSFTIEENNPAYDMFLDPRS
ncbi:MAG: threonine ammonia-lyase, biosynthetic [Xanthomonadales bacterium]|nr:threonine ammonia-lyase, biosynthetic [Gammaproteobacteria bacterium]MBT8053469.1 threonine ammonia-lyase, biosynthetic [Gammaproteobacteria bacterium]NND55837.1 threonine ammonia-lyase, biosynthetic [Xanthomonadales bacterium]NNK50943.1 threonine ammonia-lyase, biosynthetic [Xanthomonadales bacterium]